MQCIASWSYWLSDYQVKKDSNINALFYYNNYIDQGSEKKGPYISPPYHFQFKNVAGKETMGYEQNIGCEYWHVLTLLQHS